MTMYDCIVNPNDVVKTELVNTPNADKPAVAIVVIMNDDDADDTSVHLNSDSLSKFIVELQANLVTLKEYELTHLITKGKQHDMET